MIKRLIFSVLATIIGFHAFAQPENTAAPAFKKSDKPHYCPAVDQLTRNNATRIWSATGGWKSYEKSFVKEIDQFLGAQWIGIEVGQVACIYGGKNKFTFPILLIHNKLAKTPEGDLWKKNQNDGHYHCVTHQMSQCPFYTVVQSEDNSSKMNDLIDTIQHNPVQSQQVGF